MLKFKSVLAAVAIGSVTIPAIAAEPGKRLGENAVSRMLGEMEKRGIETHLGHKMKSFEDGIVRTEGGEIPADLIMFMPGLTGSVGMLRHLPSTVLCRSGGTCS